MSKIFFPIFLSLILFSCGRRDDKYQEFVDDKYQTSDDKTKESTKQNKDTASKKQTLKLVKPEVVISPLEAKEHVGKFAAVRGFVAEVTKRERVAYLNFVERYPKTPFTGVIFAENFDEFGDLSQYLYKNVEVAGLISTYKEKLQIILNDKSQIKIIK